MLIALTVPILNVLKVYVFHALLMVAAVVMKALDIVLLMENV
jgi:hypothetical protein